MPNTRFTLAADNTPSIVLPLGDVEVVVPLTSLAEEFDLSNTSDGALLDKVAAGLRYVRSIRPGDSIPKELLDGSASWTIDQRHHDLANARMRVQILGWFTGANDVFRKRAAFEGLSEDSETKQHINESVDRMAELLGLGTDNREEILKRADTLAREFAYIEALRDHCQSIATLRDKIEQLTKVFRGDRSTVPELQQISKLIRRPFEEYASLLVQIDDETADILDMLREVKTYIELIRAARDNLHAKTMQWDAVMAIWRDLVPTRTPGCVREIHDLYRFAAQHFNVGERWQLSLG